MKKFITVLLALSMVVCMFAGCSGEAPSESTAATATTTETESAAESATKTAAEANWPTGPVSIFVAAQAGSNLDIKARLVAKYLTNELGQSVVVENRNGAGGITACTQFLSEKPNSNSIQYFAAAYLCVAPIYNKIEYKSEDFIPVSGLDTVENGFFVSSKLGIKSLDGLKKYGQGRTVKFASTGTGSDTFLLSKILMDELGLQSDSINGNGFPDSLINVISGNAEVCYCALSTASQYVKDGSIIPLAVYSTDDYTGYADMGYPEVKSLKNQGYDIEYSTITWFSLRAGTDAAAVEKLAGVLEKVYANPEFQAELTKAGFYMMEDTSTAAVSARVDKMITDCAGFAERIG